MAEVAKIRKEIKEERPRRERKAKDLSLAEITPEVFKKTWRVVKLLAMIPLSLVVGLIEGVCFGFQKGLEVALELYRKELGK